MDSGSDLSTLPASNLPTSALQNRWQQLPVWWLPVLVLATMASAFVGWSVDDLVELQLFRRSNGGVDFFQFFYVAWFPLAFFMLLSTSLVYSAVLPGRRLAAYVISAVALWGSFFLGVGWTRHSLLEAMFSFLPWLSESPLTGSLFLGVFLLTTFSLNAGLLPIRFHCGSPEANRAVDFRYPKRRGVQWLAITLLLVGWCLVQAKIVVGVWLPVVVVAMFTGFLVHLSVLILSLAYRNRIVWWLLVGLCLVGAAVVLASSRQFLLSLPRPPRVEVQFLQVAVASLLFFLAGVLGGMRVTGKGPRVLSRVPSSAEVTGTSCATPWRLFGLTSIAVVGLLLLARQVPLWFDVPTWVYSRGQASAAAWQLADLRRLQEGGQAASPENSAVAPRSIRISMLRLGDKKNWTSMLRVDRDVWDLQPLQEVLGSWDRRGILPDINTDGIARTNQQLHWLAANPSNTVQLDGRKIDLTDWPKTKIPSLWLWDTHVTQEWLETTNPTWRLVCKNCTFDPQLPAAIEDIKVNFQYFELRSCQIDETSFAIMEGLGASRCELTAWQQLDIPESKFLELVEQRRIEFHDEAMDYQTLADQWKQQATVLGYSTETIQALEQYLRENQSGSGYLNLPPPLEWDVLPPSYQSSMLTTNDQGQLVRCYAQWGSKFKRLDERDLSQLKILVLNASRIGPNRNGQPFQGASLPALEELGFLGQGFGLWMPPREIRDWWMGIYESASPEQLTFLAIPHPFQLAAPQMTSWDNLETLCIVMDESHTVLEAVWPPLQSATKLKRLVIFSPEYADLFDSLPLQKKSIQNWQAILKERDFG